MELWNINDLKRQQFNLKYDACCDVLSYCYTGCFSQNIPYRLFGLLYHLRVTLNTFLSFYLYKLFCVKGKSFQVTEYLSSFQQRYLTIFTCSLHTRMYFTIGHEYTNQFWLTSMNNTIFVDCRNLSNVEWKRKILTIYHV